ncbi:peptide ABC transporter substrate-binding protein [Bifidobacterium xylocopae]|uniref:ABC transporter substrate-binding protein n=1 Tax=Bifidobacterium xylocopae TaxID=2493119 RepID=A0A366KCY1_9BIFI|nr:ABC transporter substrate-binding protein [Bifidobacterium xylocopae]RBP99580.1 ABC transporter substrate-binding protein [Bifidobacterium xylocopae]
MHRNSRFAVSAAAICSLALALSACGGGGDSRSTKAPATSDTTISVSGTEPAKPLIPSNTMEVGGGHPLDLMYSKLVRFDAKGHVHNEVAKEIKPNADMTEYRVTLQPGWKFSDGSPVTASSFTKAWSYGANAANGQLASSFYSIIKGFDELQAKGVDPKAQMSGLKVIDDLTFSVELSSPSSTFPIQVGESAFAPMPEERFSDPTGFGEHPITNGPYRFKSWEHNKSVKLVRNPDYKGGVKVRNGGIEFRVYTDPTAAYADVQSGNLDVLSTLPASALKTFRTDDQVQAVSTPGAGISDFTIPSYMKRFGQDQEGKLRRRAISMAIDRKQILRKVLNNAGAVPTDFAAPTIPGHPTSLKGSDVLNYNPKKAKELWAQANRISPWAADDTFKIAYNSDSGQKETYDAVANSIKNTLGIKAEGNPQPTFNEFRNNISARKFTDSAFRSGWQPDYPSLENYLQPNFSSTAADGNGSNDGDYKNPAFDDALKRAAAATSTDQADRLFRQAEEILLEDMPAVPLFNENAKGVAVKDIHGFAFNWQDVPDYASLTK